MFVCGPAFGAWWMTYWKSIINVLCYNSMNTQLRTVLKMNLIAIKNMVHLIGSSLHLKNQCINANLLDVRISR